MGSNYLISRLLSGRNRLARSEKDALREAILAEVAPRRRRRKLVGGALALAGAAAVVAAFPLVAGGGPGADPAGTFTPRGTGGSAASLELACAGSGEAVCEQGETVVFDVSGSAGFAHFAAFARREDGAVIWYFPEPGEAGGVPLSERAGGGALARGAVLGPDHPPGAYVVYGVFSEQPLGRDEIIARFDESRASAGPGTEVVARELVVQ